MISKFYTKSIDERRRALVESGIPESVMQQLDLEAASSSTLFELDAMAENVIGAYRLPLGVLTGLCVNGRVHTVLMATEEPSVIAGVNRAARLFNACGGIETTLCIPVTEAQIAVVVAAEHAVQFVEILRQNRDVWLNIANDANPLLAAAGGGAFDCRIENPKNSSNPERKKIENSEEFVVMTLSVRTCDAMGANAVNTMAEAVLRAFNDKFASFPGYAPCMAILTNRTCGRTVCASARLDAEAISACTRWDFDEFSRRIERASRFALQSPERAVTHNKGILNGIVAAALPLGQDTRAISCAAIDAACLSGRHVPLSQWTIDAPNHALIGRLEIPIPFGAIGGARNVPHIAAAFLFDGISSAQTGASLLAAIGLAQNFAALWALVTDGIQAGHMALHARKQRRRETS